MPQNNQLMQQSAPSITSTRTEPKKVTQTHLAKQTPSVNSKTPMIIEDDHYRNDRLRKEKADLMKLKKAHGTDDIDKKIADMKKEVARDMQINLKPKRGMGITNKSGGGRPKKQAESLPEDSSSHSNMANNLVALHGKLPLPPSTANGEDGQSKAMLPIDKAMGYKPQTLNEFKQRKDLDNQKDPPRGLGSTVGTDDWENKMVYKVKMHEFSANLAQRNKELIKPYNERKPRKS